MSHSRVLETLHNPRYAGAFVFGRTKVKRNLEGKTQVHVNKEDWKVLIQDAHVGYISWQTYESNLKQLSENARNHDKNDRKTPPREGSALLQGLVICGKCGCRMTIRYNYKQKETFPRYMCQREGIETGQRRCQDLHGKMLDEAIGEVLLETVTPLNSEITFAVQHELQSRFEHAELLRKQHVERAKYEADLARRRFMQVDPDNRLVANTLEGEWNDKLRDHHAVQEEYEKQKQEDYLRFSEEEKNEIKKLIEKFSKVWHDNSVSYRERKRLVRTIIEDVTLTPSSQRKVVMNIRFKGGATKTLEINQPSCNWETWQTSQTVIDTIDNLLNNHTAKQITDNLNAMGLTSGKGGAFNPRIIQRLIRDYHLKSYYERLRERGLLTAEEIGKLLNISSSCAKIWYHEGYLKAYPYDDKGGLLFEVPGANSPVKNAHKKRKVR